MADDTRQIGKYTIKRELGEGGQATVYEAVDSTDPGADAVAVKILHSRHSNDFLTVQRFQREASLTQQVRHRNVVRIFDQGESGGQHYMAMELLPNDLDKLVKSEGALDPSRAIELAASISEGVGQAHAQGIVHHDIKPQNVLLTAEGIPKVTDFGIARAEESGGTLVGQIMGSPPYMAPEQWAGDRGDPRSDVYSLGCLLYQLLSGDVPFRGTQREVQRLHEEEQPQPLRNRVSGIPDDIARCVEQAMAKDPGQRFDDGNVFALALRQAVQADEEPEEQPQPSSDEPAGDSEHSDGLEEVHSGPYEYDDLQGSRDYSAKRDAEQRLISMGISPKSRLTAALLGLMVGYTGAHNFYLGKTRTGIIQLVLSVFTFGLGGGWGLVVAGGWGLVDGLRIIFGGRFTDSNGLPLKLFDNNRPRNWTIGIAVAIFVVIIGNSGGTDDPPELITTPSRAAAPATKTSAAATETPVPAPVKAAASASEADDEPAEVPPPSPISPDGSKIAFVSDRDGNHEIYVMDSDGSNQTRLTSNYASDYDPSWSPDGSKIAFGSDRDGFGDIYVMD
ncbi:MAG: protein kinase, partial [Candidatus Latescibacterota bacterium]